MALVETLVNLRGDPRLFPVGFQLMKVKAPEGVVAKGVDGVAEVQSMTLAATRALGDGWLGSGESALLRVPSVPSPESWNYLLNPLHAGAAALEVEWVRSIAYDKRLFKLGE